MTNFCMIPSSYKILASKAMEAEDSEKKAAGVCLEAIQLATENYRLGNTKVSYFKKLHPNLDPIRKEFPPLTIGW